MVARPWSSSRLSCGEHLLLRCNGNAGNSFPTTLGKDPSSRARRRKRGSSACGRDSHASSRVETGMFGIFLRGSMRVPPTFRGAPIPPPSSRGGILSLFVRERMPGIPVATQEEALNTGKARGTPGSCHHSQSPPDVSVHSRESCFPCTALTF